MAGTADRTELANEVSQELERVLASTEFAKAERMKSLLSHVVLETLAGRSDRLKGYNIGIDVFERDADFDPQTNPIVRVEAGRLRRLLRNYYLGAGRSNPVRIRVPKGAYVAQFEDNRERERQPESASAQEVLPARSLTMPSGPAIAVMAFDNMSGDKARSHISDGFSEEIITQLTRFTGLFVLARHTTFGYRDRAIDLAQLGEDLEVNYVLQGSVRIAGDALRVTAQLVDVLTGMHVWADSFDRDFDTRNLLAIQDEIAGRVAAAVATPYGVIAHVEMARRAQRPVPEGEVYDFLLRWSAYNRDFDAATHRRLRREAEQLAEKHPGESMLWTALAVLETDEAAFGFNPRNEQVSSIQRSLQYCQKAVQLDPANERAFHALMLARYVAGMTDESLEAGRRALEINPHEADLLSDYGMLLCFTGMWDEGLSLSRKALELNPRHTGGVWLPFFFREYAEGNDRTARAFADRINMPTFYWAYAMRAMASGQLGDSERSRQEVQSLLELYPGFADSAASELAIWLKEDDLVQRCLEGLAKAGLPVD